MSGTTATAMSSSSAARCRRCRKRDHIDANKVHGCASQVWLVTHVKPDGAAGPVLTFDGDSDAHIVRGLIAILFALYSGKTARDILATDALALFDRIGLRENLTPQRSNGLRSMVERIRAEANAAQAAWLNHASFSVSQKFGLFTRGAGVAGPGPSAWPIASARPRSSARPWDSRCSGPISRDIARASYCTACADAA